MNLGTIESEPDLISATKNLIVKRIEVAVFDIVGSNCPRVNPPAP
jgi:hypothetical protein